MKYKYCSDCGRFCESTSVYCAFCGRKFGGSELIQCENCGEYISVNSSFCIHCGTKRKQIKNSFNTFYELNDTDRSIIESRKVVAADSGFDFDINAGDINKKIEELVELLDKYNRNNNQSFDAMLSYINQLKDELQELNYGYLKQLDILSDDIVTLKKNISLIEGIAMDFEAWAGMKIIKTDNGYELPANCCGKYETTIPHGITVIGESAFENYKELSNIIIPESVVYIGKNAFKDSSVKSVRIPKSVKEIDNNAFCFCNSLQSVIIEQGVESIGAYAFFGCPALSTVDVPYSVVNIGFRAFGYVPNDNGEGAKKIEGFILKRDGVPSIEFL